MDWHQVLATFGYPAVFLGTMLEGETVLLAGAWMVASGHLDMHGMLMAAALGAFSGDQIFFRLGVWKGMGLVNRVAKDKGKLQLIVQRLQHHRYWLMAGFRLIPGSRILVPVVLGSAGVKQAEFVLFNAIGCCIWALLFGHSGLALLKWVESYVPHGLDGASGALFLFVFFLILLWSTSHRMLRH